MLDGVPQGDPNGPTNFVIAYEDLCNALDSAQKDTEENISFKLPQWIMQRCPTLSEIIHLRRHVYVDDHTELSLFKQPENIVEDINT